MNIRLTSTTLKGREYFAKKYYDIVKFVYSVKYIWTITNFWAVNSICLCLINTSDFLVYIDEFDFFNLILANLILYSYFHLKTLTFIHFLYIYLLFTNYRAIFYALGKKTHGIIGCFASFKLVKISGVHIVWFQIGQ